MADGPRRPVSARRSPNAGFFGPILPRLRGRDPGSSHERLLLGCVSDAGAAG